MVWVINSTILLILWSEGNTTDFPQVSDWACIKEGKCRFYINFNSNGRRLKTFRVCWHILRTFEMLYKHDLSIFCNSLGLSFSIYASYILCKSCNGNKRNYVIQTDSGKCIWQMIAFRDLLYFRMIIHLLESGMNAPELNHYFWFTSIL